MSRYISVKWLEDNAKEYSLGYYDYDEYAVPLSALDEAPSIDIEPKRGEWVKRDLHWHTAICSNCNKVTMFEEWDGEVWEYNFCPNCGAEMREREGE